MTQDRLYRRQRNSVAPFAFDDDVAAVFDNMVSRSIPLYAETLKLTAELVRWHAREGQTVVDAGTSTGALFDGLAPLLCRGTIRLRAIDASSAMLEAARDRAEHLDIADQVSVECADLRDVQWNGEPIVIFNYVLQFLPPEDRLPLLTEVRRSVGDSGLIIVSEKTCADEPAQQQLSDEFYYAFKRRNGYSETEIHQKRKALDGVLVPRTDRWTENTLRQAGFDHVHRMMSWMPFVTWAAWPARTA